LAVDRRPTEQQLDRLLEAVPDQPLHLAVALSGDRERAGWWGEGRSVSWADAIETVRALAREAGVEIEVRAADKVPWHPGRCGELYVGEHSIGHAGELHPRVCRRFGLPDRS